MSLQDRDRYKYKEWTGEIPVPSAYIRRALSRAHEPSSLYFPPSRNSVTLLLPSFFSFLSLLDAHRYCQNNGCYILTKTVRDSILLNPDTTAEWVELFTLIALPRLNSFSFWALIFTVKGKNNSVIIKTVVALLMVVPSYLSLSRL